MRYAIRSIALGSILLCPQVFAAQGDPPSNPNILEALRDVQARLATIQSTLPPLSNMRATPPLSRVDQPISCFVTNHAASAKTIVAQLINSPAFSPEDNSSVIASETLTVQPLGSMSVSFGDMSAAGFFYCRFTVQDGTREDIRGAIRMSSDTTITLPAD